MKRKHKEIIKVWLICLFFSFIIMLIPGFIGGDIQIGRIIFPWYYIWIMLSGILVLITYGVAFLWDW